MRVMLVGGVPRRLHQGPVDWNGHQFEMIPHAFDRFAHLEPSAPEKPVVVDEASLQSFARQVRSSDAIFCETPEALALALTWRSAGLSPLPIIALDVHGLERVRALGRWWVQRGQPDPWPWLAARPWISWVAASDAQLSVLLDNGIDPNRVFRINGSTALYSMLLPDAEERLEGGLSVDGAAAAGLPEDVVVIPGTGRRDPVTSLEAARMLGDRPFAIVNAELNNQLAIIRAHGLDRLENVQIIPPLPVEGYFALIKRSRVVVVALLPGGGDGGHTTVSLAHRLRRAVVCSRVPGVIDYTQDGQDAVLVPPGDARALADAIEMLWDDESQRRRLTDNGRHIEAVRAEQCRQGFFRALSAACQGLNAS